LLSEAGVTIDTSAELIVEREPGSRDRMRPYRVMIDGRLVARLSEGGATTINLPPGVHDAWIKLDWTRSRKLQVNLGPGDRFYMTCQAGGGVIRAPLDFIFRSRRYIDLKESSHASLTAPATPFDARQLGAIVRRMGFALLGTILVVILLLPIFVVLRSPAWLTATVVSVLAAALALYVASRSHEAGSDQSN
jgi:hypothetical protein